MIRMTLVSLALLTLVGCASKVTTCFELGENAHVSGNFGYFYDSAEVNLQGPGHFQRLAKDSTTNPCYPLKEQP